MTLDRTDLRTKINGLYRREQLDPHCVRAKSDDRDATQLYMLLRGPLGGHLLDIGYFDAIDLYGAPPPTWAASGFIEFTRSAQPGRSG